MDTSAPRGLSEDQVLQSRMDHGSNALVLEEDRVFWNTLKGVVTEPMFLLLVAACTIYFITGAYKEGTIMAISLIFGIFVSTMLTLVIIPVLYYMARRHEGAQETPASATAAIPRS